MGVANNAEQLGRAETADIGVFASTGANCFREVHCYNQIPGNFFFVFFCTHIIGERAKRARHSQVCSIENRGYYIYIVRAIFVLITRKVGGA